MHLISRIKPVVDLYRFDIPKTGHMLTTIESLGQCRRMESGDSAVFFWWGG